ncbi:unnamed protein product [Vitrella brassicaformis CCMP3155]|uniref:Uncharacterized protein n=2 Tax=Vitrella brassicaformis TaxID=1169539 RepID=A0A0G4EJB7_VITBC|nr:unnamed protein product [Vitrella brassicaformis CCMP3155]|mmetsp:Transcript_27165/g.67762  ORF Transcript_27165/g.67762 Transcript_27165/m.67762 type:complete len:331 (+) Transcript_27165:127-1119(+)|eukprot:CEL96214.1 unnamed protein product [Vitrella brassicaformis CCMP3155]
MTSLLNTTGGGTIGGAGFENDPFLNQQPGRRPRKKRGYDGDDRSLLISPLWTCLLVFIPWVVYLTIQLLFVYAYHESKLAVLVVTTFFAAASVVVLVLGAAKRSTRRDPLLGYSSAIPVELPLGALCLIAVVVSYYFGYINYKTNVRLFWNYNEAATYKNVLPSDKAEKFADAGRLYFNENASVDVEKAVGFVKGEVWCVAPIIDLVETNLVNFWAVGQSCCDKTGGFHCDDSRNTTAKGGVVVPPTLAYRKAIQKAEAFHDIVSADHPILIRWVKSPKSIVDGQYRNAVGFLVVGVFVYLFVSFLFGAFCSMLATPDKPTPALQRDPEP